MGIKYKHSITEFSKEYNSWRKMKERCKNKNHDSYWKYGGKGISIDKEIEFSFDSFMEEVGPIPNDGLKYTLDRIDNTMGYVKGNLRWATVQQQAQNRRKTTNNKSGTRGVYRESHCWTCEISGVSSERIRVRFYINKHGEEFAKFLAEEKRNQLEIILNSLGCHY